MSYDLKEDIEISEITRRHLDMLNPYKFDQMFEELRPEYNTQQEAYEALEEEFMEVWSGPRFASFESYYRCWLDRVKTRNKVRSNRM